MVEEHNSRESCSEGKQLTGVGTIPEHKRTLAPGNAIGHLVLCVTHLVVDDDKFLLGLVGAHFYSKIKTP